MRTPLTERTQGRWSSLLPLLGVDRGFLSGRHGPCPLCGGTDRWRWRNRDGTGDWVCTQCGTGDGVEFAKRFLKLDFRQVAMRIEALLGEAQVDRQRLRPDESRLRLSMKRLWEEARPLRCEGPEGIYLRSRRLRMDTYPRCLRFAANAPYDKDRRHPAILAKVASPDDKAVNLHRIFITLEGRKTSLAPARKIMQGSIPPGSAIRLFPIGPVLGVAEGVETALAAAQLFDLPVWSVLNAGNMERFVLPDEVEEVVIFADNDANYRGQAAAYVLANRVVGQQKRTATVRIPEQADTDWNDVLFHVERKGSR